MDMNAFMFMLFQYFYFIFQAQTQLWREVAALYNIAKFL